VSWPNQDNIHLVRDVFHRWNTSGSPPPDDLIAPDFELHSRLAESNGVPYLGPGGVRAWVADLNDAYGSFRFELEELDEGPPGRVLAIGRIEVEGRGPGVGLEQPAAWLIDVRDGQLKRMQLFADQDEARAAAGVAH
jgi:ketosteroid isomerase-like protein